MAKMSLLEMTQNILSAMDSDEINSIGDTVESLQVAEAVRETYYELFSNEERPTFQGLVKLDSLSDTTQPNVLTLPENVKEIFWIKYRNNDITYLNPKQFFDFLVARIGQDETIDVAGPRGTTMTIKIDSDPIYWTTFDNNSVYFDSFNQSLESTLQQTNSLCFGQYEEDFQLTDSFIPTLDTELFPYLLAEAKASCFINFKQVSNSKEEQRSRRQRIKSQSDRWRINQRKPYPYPDYGRRRPF